MDLEQLADLPRELREPPEVLDQFGRVAELLAEHHFVIEDVEQMVGIFEETGELARQVVLNLERSPRDQHRRWSSWRRAGALQDGRSASSPCGGTAAEGSLIGSLFQAELPGDPGHCPGQPDPQRVGAPSELGGDLGPSLAIGAALEQRSLLRRQPSPRFLEELARGQLPAGAVGGRGTVLDERSPVDPPLIAALGTLPHAPGKRACSARWSPAA